MNVFKKLWDEAWEAAISDQEVPLVEGLGAFVDIDARDSKYEEWLEKNPGDIYLSYAKRLTEISIFRGRIQDLEGAVASVLPYHARLPPRVMEDLNRAVNWGKRQPDGWIRGIPGWENCIHGVNVHQQRCPECQKLP